mgnify:CR=1 FL=1
MELFEKIFNFYLSFESLINTHFYQFTIIFTLISILWISLVGIVTPVLLISAIAFGYYGIPISLLSLVLGSMINFFMATKTKNIINKLKKMKPIFSDNPFLIYIIFRLIPGIPYLAKNFSVIFFKLNLRSFCIAILISDTPQILIFTFFLKRLVDSSDNFFINQDYEFILKQMYLPILCLILFMCFIFFLKKKFKLNFIKKKNSK